MRVSNAQQQKIINELNDYRQRIQENDAQNDNFSRKINGLVNENKQLSEEVRNSQESLRLSANQISKLSSELNEYKSKIDGQAQ